MWHAKLVACPNANLTIDAKNPAAIEPRKLRSRMTKMAVTYTPRRHVFGAGFATRLTAVVRSLASNFRNWNDARATRRALNRLSDVQLRDIGLCRGDIERIQA